MLRIFDTARARVVELVPRTPGRVSMYCCGPTVYDLPHLGHGRAVLTWDILRRYLEWTGVLVDHVANITDLDDNIINRAASLGITSEEVAARYEDEWWKAMDRLGVLRPAHQPHATAFVPRMVELIAELVAGEFAYETSDGVYLEAARVPGYGLLARQSVESLVAGARVEMRDEKRSPVDFALWKKAKGPDDVPQWRSPWGAGRPGWHTECVVMSLDILGDGFDVHGGGLDLAFPHHENERAQAVALGRGFARYWVHHGFIEMGGQKMSKSLGNFTSLTDLLDRTDPRAYRLLVLRAHYRSPVEVTPELIGEATAAMQRLDALARRVGSAPVKAMGRAAARASMLIDPAVLDRFASTMDEDLDTPGAVAMVFELVRAANTALDAGERGAGSVTAATAFEIAASMGLLADPSTGLAALDEETGALVARRDEARRAKDWAESDALRAALQQRGWLVEDTKEGTLVRRG